MSDSEKSEKLEKVISRLSTYFVNLPVHRVAGGVAHAVQTVGEFFDIPYVGLFKKSGIGAYTALYEWNDHAVSRADREEYGAVLKRCTFISEVINSMGIVTVPHVERVFYKEEWGRVTGKCTGMKSLFVFPLVTQAEAIGYMIYADKEVAHIFSSGEIRALRLFTEIIGNVLERKEVEDAKSAFLSDVSHELRTPLTIIRSTIDISRKELAMGKSNVDETFDVIDTEIRYLNDIIGDLTLLTSSYEEVRNSTEQETLQIDVLLQEVVHSFQAPAKEKGITLTLGDVPQEEVCGVLPLLKKGFRNIIANAIRYSDAGGTIAVRGYEKKGMLCISVEDSGIGIPKEDMPHIFDRFYRVEQSRSRAFGGTGLGLAIVKLVVEAHEGSIEVESTKGEGSTFTLCLPVYEEATD